MARDLLASSKALLALDADGALVPHGLGGHGRGCLTWCVEEIDRLRIENAELRADTSTYLRATNEMREQLDAIGTAVATLRRTPVRDLSEAHIRRFK